MEYPRTSTDDPSALRGAAPCVPDDVRLYAIGDIHGRLDLLTELLDRIYRDRAGHDASHHKIIFLGDYIDRGGDARALLDFISTGQIDGFETIYLVGNHEDYLLRFLDDTAIGPNWLKYGGAVTLTSYGITPDAENFHRVQKELRLAVPENHLAFLRGLKTWHIEGSYLFVHAGIRPGVPIARQTRHDLTFSREGFVDCAHDHGHVVVHGHTVCAAPELLPNRINIDTGAFSSGTLTCLVLQGASRAILQT
jgi:serine/threonine protein phosphatase 1|tara:strand:+ start:447 stop:1199 length:753 start_codon:yes stop_codon:yes gene_type:complete